MSNRCYTFITMDSESSEFTDDQPLIKIWCPEKYNTLCSQKLKVTIYSDKLEKCINKLKHNSSLGMDSVTSEYSINGNSSHLFSCLAFLYAQMLELESIIMPDVTLNNNQFGFRKGCDTSFRIGLLNIFYVIINNLGLQCLSAV